jgi:hypothetical protein
MSFSTASENAKDPARIPHEPVAPRHRPPVDVVVDVQLGPSAARRRQQEAGHHRHDGARDPEQDPPQPLHPPGVVRSRVEHGRGVTAARG